MKNSSIYQHIKNMLKLPVSNPTMNSEPVLNEGVNSLFIIANVTRAMLYQYATISSNGTISLHVMSPFNFIDDNQLDPQYKKKTCYVSVNQDPNRDKKDPTNFYNNNFGNFLTLLKPAIMHNDKSIPNPFNKLVLASSRIKQALIPADINNQLLNEINAPAKKLKDLITEHMALEIEHKEKVSLNILAYQEYELEVLELVERGLLVYSFIIINPIANSVSFDMGLEESMNAQSNPWLNFKQVTSQGNPISAIPVINKYSAVIQIIDTSDLNAMYSDNNDMLGKRTIWTDQETGRSREAITKVAIIKDYNSDTPILLAITDSLQMPNQGNRSRVEAFEALLDKGINTFTVYGSLSPVVRLTNTNAGRNGNIIFELRVERYSVYQSNNLRTTIEADAFESLSFESIMGDEETAQSFVIDVEETNTDLTQDLSISTSNNTTLI